LLHFFLGRENTGGNRFPIQERRSCLRNHGRLAPNRLPPRFLARWRRFIPVAGATSFFSHSKPNAGTSGIKIGFKIMSGYSSNKEPPKPPIEQVGPYRNNTAPAAAKAGVGAKSLAEIQEALDACRRHNEGLSKRDIGPGNPAAGHDAKQK
jgi:hypothetical protein